MQSIQFIKIFFVNNLEVIKNISLFLVSIIVFTGLTIFYFKVYINVKKIREINKKIEEAQKNLDQMNIDSIRGIYEIIIDPDKNEEKNIKSLEQHIQKLRRKKEYLLEEISILKIFKK